MQRLQRCGEHEAPRFAEHQRHVGADRPLVGHPHGRAAVGGEIEDQPAEQGGLGGAGAGRIEHAAAEHQRRRFLPTGNGDGGLQRLQRGAGQRVGDRRRDGVGNGNGMVERGIEGENDVGHGETPFEWCPHRTGGSLSYETAESAGERGQVNGGKMGAIYRLLPNCRHGKTAGENSRFIQAAGFCPG